MCVLVKGRACRDTLGLRWDREDVTRTLIFFLLWWRETEGERQGENRAQGKREWREGDWKLGRKEKGLKGKEKAESAGVIDRKGRE